MTITINNKIKTDSIWLIVSVYYTVQPAQDTDCKLQMP